MTLVILFQRINARALIVEVDSLTGNDEIGKFECRFDIRPKEIAQSASVAQFSSPAAECVPEKQSDQIR